ncbi:hypothetical protein ACP059_18570 [Bacillus cabrialesii]|uniref:hypothetical protein n=1 Tax=Bacillus cabrialesii TaxID=2487276 RepID=UPI003CF09A73
MVIKLKLYEIANKTILSEIQDKFEAENIISFTDRYIGVRYNYSNVNYSYLLNYMRTTRSRQVILNPNKFLKIIQYCLRHNIYIEDLNFVKIVPEDSYEFVQKYLDKINDGTEEIKLLYRDKLFSELDWIVSDEGIDIEDLKIQMEIKDNPIYSNVNFYNNGIITTTQNVSDELQNLVEFILED